MNWRPQILDILPVHLNERSRVVDSKIDLNGSATGEFVLYWMRTAVRSDENPALDVAIRYAHEHNLPLLVYHAISEKYEFASDRHHLFMLQGARDIQQQFKEKQISYAFHLERMADRRPHLFTLAKRARVVVTEDMPVNPPKRFLKVLGRRVSTPIVCVDTACIAPMLMLAKAYTRAYKFRAATEKIYAQRLTAEWPSQPFDCPEFDPADLPFDPIDLQKANLGALVAECEIDHAIGPVVDTVGGSEAGYQRWNHFREKHLKNYAKKRNNALLDGVSRMSPYLHYGMVSPFRMARETADSKCAGAEKFLDELLIWRELAYSFCFHREDHDQWSALPEWAQETLASHADDERENLFSWETLARGQSNDPFWNAAQASLLKQGELHNNVRMTWGKAILNWKNSPQESLATIIDLNHRYALDGRDPASYGGILWCLGQFDRPFEPERKVLGTVRSRSTSSHARRLDTQDFLTKVSAPRFSPVPHVAVVGAGISGLFAARTLQDHGLQVTVFEKSRGVGGRMSTRRHDGAANFDHGAQYFTARDLRFRRYVDSWIEQGIVARWPDANLADEQKIVVLENGRQKSESNSQVRYVAVPTMNSICKHLATGVNILTQRRIGSISKSPAGFELLTDDDQSVGRYDRLIVSAPAEQTADLLKDYPAMSDKISRIEMNPCWALMVACPEPITDQWVGAFLHNSFLSWVARNSTKPGRSRDAEHLVIHATPDWTAQNWESDPDVVCRAMLDEFWKVAGIRPQEVTHQQAHRWKYAIPQEPSDIRAFSDESASVVCCGDWASGSRVEGAFLSGMAAAGRILTSLAAP